MVSGKLDMLKTCYEVQDASQKYWKIKSNIKKGEDQEEALVYNDASDDEDQLDQIMD